MSLKYLLDRGFTLKDGVLSADDDRGCTFTLRSGMCVVRTEDGEEFSVPGIVKIDIKRMTVAGAGKVGIDLG